MEGDHIPGSLLAFSALADSGLALSARESHIDFPLPLLPTMRAGLLTMLVITLVSLCSHTAKGFTMSLTPSSPRYSLERSVRSLIKSGIGMNIFSDIFSNRPSNALTKRSTNAVISKVKGIRHKRLGDSDIIISEMGLGTQRWVSEDFNAPSESQCFEFMNHAILHHGINFIDTAEQYPIPSSTSRPEGSVETVIGKWLSRNTGVRSKVVIASKITGGRVITKQNIASHLDNTLRRLGTDYLDVYQLHWPARYSPQSNWGQSLQYHHEVEPYFAKNAGFEEICLAMGDLVKQGKIRGWGLCNDNAFGLTACCEIAKRLGVAPIVSMQNDFSLIDRRAEENGVSEAASAIHENVGFMAYNALAGGYLTGKYLQGPPPTYDNPSYKNSQQTRKSPRGRHDDPDWSRTLYRYRSAAANSALSEYAKLAEMYGMSLTELSLRWCRQRQLVTSVLLGQSSLYQLEEDIKIFQIDENLPEDLMWQIDRVHMRNRLPIFSSDRVGKDWYGEGEIGELIP